MSGLRNKTELVLALLYASDISGGSQPVVGITRLEKLIFLAKIQEALLSDAVDEQDFHFVPFRMGPWTQEVYDEIDFLESIGLLVKEERPGVSVEDEAHNDELFSDLLLDKYQSSPVYRNEGTDAFQLTAAGRKKAADIWSRLSIDEKQKLMGLKRKFNTMNLKQLLRYVYKKYPEYTEASEIKEYLNLY
jgi:hypothetical protein